MNKENPTKNQNINSTNKRPYIAVASEKGLFINLNLHECNKLRIYNPELSQPKLIDIREIPKDYNSETLRWKRLAEILNDCSYLLVYGIDPTPQSILRDSGLSIFIIEGFVDKVLIRINEGKNPNLSSHRNILNRNFEEGLMN